MAYKAKNKLGKLMQALIAGAIVFPNAFSSVSSSSVHSSREGKRVNVHYSSLVDHLDDITYKDSRTKGRFVKALQNLESYKLEPIIDRFCDGFGLKEEEILPYLIVESKLNPNAKTSGGCWGIGQVSKVAVRATNKFYGTNFKYGSGKEDQIGSSLGYFAKTIMWLNSSYPGIKRDDLLALTYSSYNAGGMRVRRAVNNVKRKHKALKWENVKSERIPKITKAYVSDARAYGGYLDQLAQFRTK